MSAPDPTETYVCSFGIVKMRYFSLSAARIFDSRFSWVLRRRMAGADLEILLTYNDRPLHPDLSARLLPCPLNAGENWIVSGHNLLFYFTI